MGTRRAFTDGQGATKWWLAIQQLEKGGGGGTITFNSLVAQMGYDYPGNADLAAWLARRGRGVASRFNAQGQWLRARSPESEGGLLRRLGLSLVANTGHLQAL